MDSHFHTMRDLHSHISGRAYNLVEPIYLHSLSKAIGLGSTYTKTGVD